MPVLVAALWGLAALGCDGSTAPDGPDALAGAPPAGSAAPASGERVGDPLSVEVTTLDIIEEFARPDSRVRILAQNARQPLYCGPGNFEKKTQLASDEAHKVIDARAESAFEIKVGPLPKGARLLARTLVYSQYPKDPALADPAPITYRILIDGKEAASLRSDYILEQGPSEHPYDKAMRTLSVPLDAAVAGPVTLRFETTRLGAPEPGPEVVIPEPLWWDLAVQQPVAVERGRADRAHPNVLLLVVDTLAARHMSLYGYARDTTPHLAAFAARGLRFDRAISMSSWTLPAVASLLTGLSPNEHGVLGALRNYLMDGLRTWPEVLQEQGVLGGAFIANTLIAKANNFDQGFDHWEQANDETAEQLDARLLAWLDAQPKGARWLGYVHYMDPHAPYAAPGAARQRFDEGTPAPEALSKLMPERVQRGEVPMPDEVARRQLVALYDAEIAYFDACFGRLIAALEQRGLLADTLVVLTADHGEELFDHGRWGHGYSLYDELLHVPLVVVGPGFAPGGVRADAVSTAAVGSLVLGAAHASAIDGALRMPPPPDVGGAGPLVYSAVRTDLFGPQCNLVAVQDALRKLIWSLPEDATSPPLVECFDLRADPLEQHPLPSCDEQMLKAAQDWYHSTAARRLAEPQPENPEILEMLRANGYIGGEPARPKDSQR